ncbi:MAG: chemotaxis protein CheC, partial [Clostridia bacterium]|nr:chemotaxis protein CheC [Clostridia bacterium]
MVLDWDHLGSLQVDALREIGSIGAGNAATALAQLLNQKVAMTVPQAGILSLEALIRGLGHEEEPVACVSTLVGGEASAMVLFIWRAPDAFTLVDLLLGRP